MPSQDLTGPHRTSPGPVSTNPHRTHKSHRIPHRTYRTSAGPVSTEPTQNLTAPPRATGPLTGATGPSQDLYSLRFCTEPYRTLQNLQRVLYRTLQNPLGSGPRTSQQGSVDFDRDLPIRFKICLSKSCLRSKINPGLSQIKVAQRVVGEHEFTEYQNPNLLDKPTRRRRRWRRCPQHTRQR